MTTNQPVICAVARTPIGKFLGQLSSFSAVDLGVFAVQEVCKRAGVSADSGIIDEVLLAKYFKQELDKTQQDKLHLVQVYPFQRRARPSTKCAVHRLKQQ